MIPAILTAELRYEHDVVLARQRARQIARLLGFDGQEQIRIATAVSEVARNAYQYAGGGKVVFALATDPPRLEISVRDNGPGIARLQEILDGRYYSRTGMGLGLLGARRLSDRFDVRSSPDSGTVVVLGKLLPRSASPDADTVARVSRELSRLAPHDPLSETREQNQELLRALDEVRERQAEVERLNQELSETNRGVLALYAELDEKAADLARASELKSRFLSNISHELRTPLNAILNITGLLLERVDGPLLDEQ
ncbi:MAG TPA: ATP-binding protein, partial [Gemmatimonadales bacterium]|nr:ATP-binding protein [Gemmatimonadales bacterium]